MLTFVITHADIRGNLGKRHVRENFDETAHRKHFLTRQDCRNACRKLKDFKNHRHSSDAISVQRIVNELSTEDPCPVLVYKPSGSCIEKYSNLREENFLLLLMTKFQADLFGKFSDLTCIDATHKTNEYGYKLITLMVRDEYNSG